MAIPELFLEQLKQQNDVESVISAYVDLKRRGRTLSARCPFHSDSTPSFHVYPDTQSFYCFGCGAGGDVVTFIRRIENLDYMEAIRFLAKRGGLTVPEDAQNHEAVRQKASILEMNREAARFYHSVLTSAEGKAGMDYLLGRGLSEKTIRHFGLGYAPDRWDSLLKYLRQKKYAMPDILASSLVSRGRNDSQYDAFRDRVIFPIIDLRGNVIGFGGRALSERGPKYLNSSDTPVFKKSRNLFALNFAKSSKEKRLILAEGYMDVIALHQGGFTNSVATLGTALTPEQARLIRNYCEEVVVAYDSDGPGQAATNRAIGLLGDVGVDVKILKIEGAKDPDEYIKKFGAGKFRLLIEGSGDAVWHQIVSVKDQFDLMEPKGKANFLNHAAKVISALNNSIEREVYAGQVAQEFDASKEAILLQIRHIYSMRKKADQKKETKALLTPPNVSFDKVNPQRKEHYRAALAEEKLLSVLFKNQDYFSYIYQKVKPDQFITVFNAKVYAAFCQRIQNNMTLDLTSLSSEFTNEEMGVIAGVLAPAMGGNLSKAETDQLIAVILEEKLAPSDADIVRMQGDELEDFIQKIASKKG